MGAVFWFGLGSVFEFVFWFVLGVAVGSVFGFGAGLVPRGRGALAGVWRFLATGASVAVLMPVF
ncbi:hypothetical protein OG943_34710 [Amycolatopsis sp. NBC_00345]|uniref:hypothetical protein n=1 Tax=Amycolatopsis sp. NBC_00345 TaxID=2975955 RepID=UPI002E25DE2A